MTRQEIVDLLEVLTTAYPYAKIKDATSMVDAWEMALGDYSAESVYKASRYHMDNCKFFPTVADIKDNIVRAELVYNGPNLNSLPSGQKEGTEEFLDAFCKWIGFGCEPDDNVELPKGFLPYEQ